MRSFAVNSAALAVCSVAGGSRPLWLQLTCALAAMVAIAPLPLHAQTDAPPELENPAVPGELPEVELPPPSAGARGAFDLYFVGATAISEDRLREGIQRQIQNIEEIGLDPATAYDAAYFTGLLYRREGYSQVAVESEITGPSRLRLTIVEGPRTTVGPVEVQGNTTFDVPTLTNYLLGPTRERYPRIKEDLDLPFVEAEIEEGRDLVNRLYASEGFLDAEVSEPQFTFNAGKTIAAISLNVQEGTRYRFGNIRFEGDMVYTRQELLAQITEETTDPYTDGRLASARRKLLDHYKKNGYFTATVDATSDPTLALDGRVPVVFTIAAGGVYRFDGITVSGNEDVPAEFIRKRFQRLTGRVYSPGRIDRQFRRVIETGLFRTLNITPEAIAGNLVRLNVTVDEALPREWGFGAGFATHEGALASISYANRNLYHSGRPFNAEVEVSSRGYSGEVAYQDPWLWDTQFKLELRAYAENRQEEGYIHQESGFQPSLSRRISRNWEVTTYLLAKHVTTKEITIQPMELVGPDEYGVVAAGLTNTFDYRNNRALPTSGWINSTGLEYAPDLIGKVGYFRATNRFSIYFPITARSHLALGARGAVTAQVGDEELPIEERQFNGGANSVRSFPHRELGPKDEQGDDPIGGAASTTFNAEYTFPLVGDLKGAVFFDAGNVMPNISEFGYDDMRYAIGLGARYNLPIGSIRLDYGYNPDRKEGEPTGAFHFAIGVAF